ncbi:PspA/IM30 family protein [Paenibacillus aurantiacus]|uniref:PspA/IM30 family protein n=1 Tax=Paenibacillus aurantiacus TaxID=1936118 RepID=A0ABV5KWW0_9BACL
MKLALQEKLMQEKKLAAYQVQFETIQEQTKTLTEKIDQLLVQSEEYNHRRLLLTSRVNVAISLKDMNQTVITVQTANIAKGFARAEEQAFLIEAELEASTYFASTSKRSAPQFIDPNLSSEIDNALDELKAAGSEGSAIDAHLEGIP